MSMHTKYTRVRLLHHADTTEDHRLVVLSVGAMSDSVPQGVALSGTTGWNDHRTAARRRRIRFVFDVVRSCYRVSLVLLVL